MKYKIGAKRRRIIMPNKIDPYEKPKSQVKKSYECTGAMAVQEPSEADMDFLEQIFKKSVSFLLLDLCRNYFQAGFHNTRPPSDGQKFGSIFRTNRCRDVPFAL